MGLLLAVLVTAADVDDSKAALELFARLDGQPMSKFVRMYADSKCHNIDIYAWVQEHEQWELSIVRRPKDAKGWVLLPIRWTVERTFAWLERFSFALRTAEEKGDWLPAPGPLNFAERVGGRLPVPLFPCASRLGTALGRCRCLSKDRVKSVRSSEA